MRQYCVSLPVLTLAFLLSACVTTPSPESPTHLLSLQEERRLGLENHPEQVARFGGLYDHARLTDHVREVGQKLAALSDLSGQTVSFTLLDSERVAAFANLGGHIYLTRSILSLLASEDELAAILAHELNHVRRRDSAASYHLVKSSQEGNHSLEQALSRLNAPPGTSPTHRIEALNHSHETAADVYAVHLLDKAGYDPSAVSRMLENLTIAKDFFTTRGEQASQNVSSNSITAHPNLSLRQQYIQQALDQLAAPVRPVTNTALLDALDNTVFGTDPTKAIIRGRSLFYPSARLKLTVPDEFTLRPLNNGVLATADEGTNHFRVEIDRPYTQNQTPLMYLQDLAAKTSQTPVDEIRIAGHEGWGLSYTTRIGEEKTDHLVRDIMLKSGNTSYHRFTFVVEATRDAYLSGLVRTVISNFSSMNDTETARFPLRRLRIVTIDAPATAEEQITAMETLEPGGGRLFEILNGLKPGEKPAVGSRVKVVR